MNVNHDFRNVMFIDGAQNCAYDIFAATPGEFKLFFPAAGQDIAFYDEIWPFDAEMEDETPAPPGVAEAFGHLWRRPVAKAQVTGLHGIIFGEELGIKKQFYPNRRNSDLMLSLDLPELGRLVAKENNHG